MTIRTRSMVCLFFGSLCLAQPTEPHPTPAEWDRIQSQIKSMQQISERQGREIQALKSGIQLLQNRFPQETRRLDQRIQEVGATTEASRVQLGSLESRFGRRTLWVSSALAIFALVAGAMFLVLRRRNQGLDLRIKEARNILDQETVKLDEKLVELLGNQMRTPIQEFSTSIPSKSSSPTKPDHSLALRVGEEIYRMRQRLTAMPGETKGLKPLIKSLERLEEDFTKQGYELVELLHQTYSETLIAKARFIPSDELEQGQRVITRVVKPPILFQGELVEIPEIEVSLGG